MESSNIFHWLFDQGDFELILQRIFLLLDGASLEACSLVCKQWRQFILRLFQRQKVQNALRNSWSKGVSSSRRIQLGSRFMAMKADGTSIAVGLEDGSIELWERIGQPNSTSKLKQAQPYRRLAPANKHNDLVRVIDLSPHWIVSGSWDASIKLWNRSNGTLLSSYVSEEGPISGIHLNESSKYILFSARSGKVKKLKISQDECLVLCGSFEMNHGDCIIDISIDDNYLLSGGSDAKLLLWNFENGKF